MTKKTYEMVARILKKEMDRTTSSELSVKLSIMQIAIDLCLEFKRDNSRFQQERFLSACGLFASDENP